MSALRHGTHSTYKNHGCRCPACRKAAADYQRDFRARLRSGGSQTRPIDEAREHLRRLAESGVSRGQVARLTGISRRTLWVIEQGRRRRLLASTHEAIAAVPLGTTEEALLVPAEKARRLIAAMGEAGVSHAQVSEALRYESGHSFRLERRAYVKRLTWRRLVTLYRLLARQGLVPADLLEEVGA